MPDTPTSRLGLYKSLPDGSEIVNYTQDLGQNWDKIDLASGFQACTSTTRPSSPYNGKAIRETDTARTYLHNGSSPASGGWVQIPNSASTFNADLNLTSGGQLIVGGSPSDANLAVINSTTSATLISGRLPGDTVSRWFVNTDGNTGWGPGGSTFADVTLARTGTATLTLTGSLTVTGNLSASGIGQKQFVRKTADETLTSNATLQNDDHLSAAVAANATYTFEVVLFTIEASGDFVGDIKTAFTIPASSTLHMMGTGAHVTDLSSGTSSNAEWIGRPSQTTSPTQTLSYGVGTSQTALVLKGIIITGGTSGTLQLQWAQNVSDASGLTIKAGSWMVAERVA
ncbi:hypothetical protein [Streptomyces violaceusniger]|uniref:hypothetical protein n=1 Tax=Streptomyces violaceusniger TaxID=68280 RepID=UPI00367CD70B